MTGHSNINPSQVDPQLVTKYVDAVIQDADKVWTQWMLQVGFKEPYVQYYLIQPGQTYKFNNDCTSLDSRSGQRTATFDSDFPNAFYCDYQINDRNEPGVIILPEGTLAKVWAGDIIGNPSSVVGDFAVATIVSHEFGHHVVFEMARQLKGNVTGNLQPTDLPNPDKNNELIADCFAGVWTAALFREGGLEDGDIDEALAALAAIGDKPGRTPSQPHGSAEERDEAFKIGIYGTQSDPRSGVPANCIRRYWSTYTGPI
jgi:uncharacterized protein